MKRLPDSELELMMIIWDLDKPVTRFEIEDKMCEERKLSPTTILSFLSRFFPNFSRVFSPTRK